jgi:two-component system phosphate regulon sensor histidine kinase PhoR
MEGNLRFYNSQFAILFQKFSLKEKKYRIGEIIRDPQVQDAIRGVQQSGAPVIIDNLQLAVGSTDTIKNFRISFAPLLYSDTKRLRGVLAVFHDITDIRRAEQVRIDFVANVSHELRSPLTSIKGYAETLQADLKSASPILQKCAEAIGRNTNRLIDLVNDLLKISSLESGAELELQNIDLAEWTERIIHPFLKRAKEKNLELKWDVKARQLKADSARLEQVVVNLLENALKYNTSGKNIFLRWEEEENETLLVVGDDGPGIASEHHARLFERFYRVDGGRDREQGGTGLGLSIVKHIVLRHHGRVDVRGDLGQGTEFICTFPNSK